VARNCRWSGLIGYFVAVMSGFGCREANGQRQFDFGWEGKINSGFDFAFFRFDKRKQLD